MKKLTIQDIGPIAHVAIPVPEEGIVVFQGEHGIGKSSAIEALETAATGRGRLDVRDGAPFGEVEAFGIRLRVGKNQRRTGTADVEVISERFALDDFVDPGLKTPDLNNARRAKIAVAMSGVKPSADLFAELLDQERYAEFVGLKPDPKDDLVTFTQKVKGKLESKSREAVAEADGIHEQMVGQMELTRDIDTTAESDAAVLQQRLERRVEAQARLVKQRDDAKERREKAEEAQAALDAIGEAKETVAEIAEMLAVEQEKLVAVNKQVEKHSQGTPAAELAKQADTESDAGNEAVNAAKEYEAQIAKLKELYDKEVKAAEGYFARAQELRDQADAAEAREKVVRGLQGTAETQRTKIESLLKQRTSAERNEKLTAGWKAAIAAAKDVELPTEEEIAAAAAGVRTSREAIERGAEIRKAKAAMAEYERLKVEWNAKTRLAEDLRLAAGSVETVITDAIQRIGVPFVWHHGMLCLPTDRSETELYDDLSRGEQWLEAIRMGIKLGGKGSVLFIRQEGWEGFNQEFRSQIAKMLEGTGVLIVTAEVTTGKELVVAQWKRVE